jgi:L-fuculose-phosphate aldolase
MRNKQEMSGKTKISYIHPAEEIATVMDRIYWNEMTTASGGNASIRDTDGSIWISPKGVDKGNLGPGDIIHVLNDGTIEGIHEVSTEYPFHRDILNARPDINAVLHAHPPSLVSFSIVRKIPDTKVLPNARNVCGVVGYAKYALPGSAQLGKNLVDAFAKGNDVVIMENHGIVTVGKTLDSAFQRLETLDFCARLWIRGRSMGDVRVLTDSQLEMGRKKLSPVPEEFERTEPMSSREKTLRKELCKFIQRSYDRQLVTSTEGTFSARLDKYSFIITPYGVDRKQMDVSCLVLIESGKREKGTVPSKSVFLHQKIYQDHPEINSILIAHPPNVLSFGVTKKKFDTRIIPESYVILRDIRILPYETQFLNKEKLSALLASNPIVMCENDCVIVTGKSLLESFDRLEVAEYSAQAIISAKNLGSIFHISGDERKEIAKVFISS